MCMCCVCVYMYEPVCVCVFICMCMPVFVCVYTCVCQYVCLWVSMCVCLCVSVCISVCICGWVCLCLCLCVQVYICVSECVLLLFFNTEFFITLTDFELTVTEDYNEIQTLLQHAISRSRSQRYTEMNDQNLFRGAEVRELLTDVVRKLFPVTMNLTYSSLQPGVQLHSSSRREYEWENCRWQKSPWIKRWNITYVIQTIFHSIAGYVFLS